MQLHTHFSLDSQQITWKCAYSSAYYLIKSCHSHLSRVIMLCHLLPRAEHSLTVWTKDSRSFGYHSNNLKTVHYLMQTLCQSGTRGETFDIMFYLTWLIFFFNEKYYNENTNTPIHPSHRYPRWKSPHYSWSSPSSQCLYHKTW